MRLVVIDASVAIKWYVREDDSEKALSLLGGKLLFFAPDLFFVEVAAALVRQCREYGQLSSKQVDSAIDELLRVGVETMPGRTLVSRAARLALEIKHPVRDCFYLALAERWEATLVTADQQLLKKANQVGLEKYVIALANSAEIL
jgi:hypothetical protein